MKTIYSKLNFFLQLNQTYEAKTFVFVITGSKVTKTESWALISPITVTPRRNKVSYILHSEKSVLQQSVAFLESVMTTRYFRPT